MSQPIAERKKMDILAEEFVARYRGGERPALTEYITAHPELADEIRELFPTLVLMEELAPSDSGSFAANPLAPAERPRLSLGNYRILCEIGRGGMGVVYEAEQLSLGRHVALKVLPRHAAGDDTVRQRFHREARAAAQLHHSNIVPVFEVGEDPDSCWYAMQLILGQGLDQVIEELRQQRHSRSGSPLSSAPGPRTGSACPPLSQVTQSLVKGQFVCLDFKASTPRPTSDPAERASPDASDSTFPASRSELSAIDSSGSEYYRSVARIGQQAAEGMAYAHARGIIHRDVKPSNLLLDTAGVVWITDFGLAKTRDNSLTSTGDVVGTLRYMAPERFKGESDERADVYGLGLTLYELLVLRPAFTERDRLQLIDRIKYQEPDRPRVLDHRIPRDLETIVLKAMSKEAKRRYPSAEALTEDLRRFLANEPIQARRTSELERLCLWGRRNPALAVLSASLLLLLVLIAAGATATTLYLQATLNVSEGNRQLAELAQLDGKHELWRSYLSQAQARRMSRHSGQRFASLRALKEALALPVPPGHSRDELRTEAIAALCLPDLELAREGGREMVGADGFAIDAAFQRYAVADKDGNVSIRRLSDNEELLRLPGAGLMDPYRGLHFSPDGRFLHQRCDVRPRCRSRLWNLDGPEPKAVLDDDTWCLTFTPDSRQCAACYPDKTVRLFDTSSGRELRRFSVASLPSISHLSWNPKFPQLLFSVGTSLRLLNVDTGKVTSLGLKVARGAWADWHPEGRLLAVADKYMRIHLWDVAADRPALPPLEGHKVNGIVMRFNHAGDRLLSTDWANSWHLWDARTGRLLLTLPAHGKLLYFSPDDRLVGAGGDGKVQLFHFRRGEELRTVIHRIPSGEKHYDVENGSFVDPEGRLCALTMVSYAEGIPLVDVARGEEVALLPIPGNAPVHFDGEGALWTCGSAGLLRWPMADEPANGQRRYGPPQRLAPVKNGGIRGNSDLRVLAIPERSRGTVVLHRDGNRQLRLGPQEEVRYCAVSPDARWVATGSHWLHEGAGAKVWDAGDGKHVKDLPVGPGRVQFSPDGKWLLTMSGGCRLWAVGTWEEGPKLGGSPVNASGAFSGDGKLLALGDALSVVRLVVTDSGVEIARLTVPEETGLVPGCFTPDGTRLIAGGWDTRDLYVFDLTAIRARLAELDLDWDAPPLPASASGVASAPRDATPLAAPQLSIQLDGIERR